MSNYKHIEEMFGEQGIPRPLDYTIWTCIEPDSEWKITRLKEDAEKAAINLHCLVGESFWGEPGDGTIGVLIIGQRK